MNSIARGFGSVGISVASGCAFAFVAAMAIPEALLVFPIPMIAGAVIGLVTSPAAVFALALPACRPSFAWVFAPTAAVSLVGCLIGGPAAAIAGSVPVYVGLCVTLGVVAFRRRRHLVWFEAGRCPACGYEMAGLGTVTCPECGCDTTIKPRWRTPAAMMRA